MMKRTLSANLHTSVTCHQLHYFASAVQHTTSTQFHTQSVHPVQVGICFFVIIVSVTLHRIQETAEIS